ncbi:TSUP family transporter, partial [Mycobacteroides chelonae]
VGFVVGAWSAALGLGGGLLTVPAMLVLFGSDLHVAEGTSLMVMLPNALVAATTHLRQGTADAPIGFRLAAFALPGTVIGALLALALNARWLALVFGSYLVFIAIREIVRVFTSSSARTTTKPSPAPASQACVGG